MTILCTIDLETREVSIPSGQCIAAYDHNVDVIRFQAETIPGFSLDTSSIRIAAQGPNKVRHDYAVDPSTVQIEEETGYITFDWPIPAGVTEMPIGTFKYGDKGNLIFAVCAEIISGDTVSKAWHSDDGIITVVAHLEPESGGGEDPEEEATNAQKIAQLQTDVAVINTQVGALANGSPTPVATVAEMTDESAVYLYTGSETGYTAGNWYFWNGSAWTSGGTYGGAVTSTTFTEHGVPADDFAVGEALAEKADADDVTVIEGDVADLKGDLNAMIDVFVGENKTDPALTYGATINNTTGAITADSYYRCSAKIPCEYGETLYIINTNTQGVASVRKTNNDKIAFYQSDDTFISIGYNADNYPVPQNTAYCVQQGYNAQMRDGQVGIFKKSLSELGTVWIPFSETKTVKYSYMPDEVVESIVETQEAIENIDDVYIEYVMIPGNSLIPKWELGDISTSGANAGEEVASSTYWRTPLIPVDVSSVFLATVTTNAEGTPVRNKWTNTTYGVVCCYSDSEFLGTASPSSDGIVQFISGTTGIRICHTQTARTNDFCVYKSELEYPSGHDDIVSRKINTSKIADDEITKSKLSFCKNGNSCVANKDYFSPWYVFSTSQLISSVVAFEQGTYVFSPSGSDITYLYVDCYNATKEFISRVNISATNFGKPFTLPAGTTYIQCKVAISNGVLLSKLTGFDVYRRAVAFFGETGVAKVIDIDTLPTLPPLALTGQTGGGIISLGHGGVSSIYAEDSIESFYALARLGFSGSEVDIQFTKDHVPVCWHNPTLQTLAGGTANDHIYDYTLAELDANFDFTTWWDTRSCFRKTVARFEEFCVLARAYGWIVTPDKLTSAEGSEETDNAVLIEMLKKYKLNDKLILNRNFGALRQAFPDAPLCLSSMEASKDDSWMNGLLSNTIPEHCHEVNGNMVVDDDYVTYTAFNWKTVKRDEGISACVETNELCDRHNVRLIWYTVETPEDIYQLVSQCPSTSIVLTGLYSIPDGMNQYLGLGWSNTRYGLNNSIEV